MILWLILAVVFAGLEALVIRKGWHRGEFVTKPAVVVCLFLGLVFTTGLQGNLLWFGLGLVFSLLGDVLLLFPQERLFLAATAAFLLTHIFYILGFNEQLLAPTAWSLVLLLIVLLNAVRLLRQMTTAMRQQGHNRLVYPIILYGLVISLMLAVALSTLSDRAWGIGAAFLVSLGAFLFWLSDLMLGWNKFVAPLKGGRLPILALYHLGQISLIAGVVLQFKFK